VFSVPLWLFFLSNLNHRGTEDTEVAQRRACGAMTVSLEQTDEGADAALAIKSADGLTALLRFRSAVLPEMVDAVAV